MQLGPVAPPSCAPHFVVHQPLCKTLCGTLVQRPCAATLCGSCCGEFPPMGFGTRFPLRSSYVNYQFRKTPCEVPCAGLVRALCERFRARLTLCGLVWFWVVLCGFVRRPCAPHGFLGMDGPCAASCFSDVPLQQNPCESLCASCVWQPFPCEPYARFFFDGFFFSAT